MAGDENTIPPVVKLHFNCPGLVPVSNGLNPVCLRFCRNIGHGESTRPPVPPEVGFGASTFCATDPEILISINIQKNMLTILIFIFSSSLSPAPLETPFLGTPSTPWE